MLKIGVVLSGSGVYDGSELHEAVLTMLALDRAGTEQILMAPNIDQLHTVNHLNGNEMENENRNVLVEAARIARGNIREMSNINASELDALIIPGGYGVAKNLSDYAMVGPECEVNPDVMSLVVQMLEAGKPIGSLCISPVMIAKIMSRIGRKARLTIGNNTTTARDIDSMGQVHVPCEATGIVIDQDNKIVTSPAYMSAARISDVATGIDKLVAAVIDLIK